MGAASSAAAPEAPPLPLAVWIAVVVSAIACAAIALCAGATPLVCPWHKPKRAGDDSSAHARLSVVTV